MWKVVQLCTLLQVASGYTVTAGTYTALQSLSIYSKPYNVPAGPETQRNLWNVSLTTATFSESIYIKSYWPVKWCMDITWLIFQIILDNITTPLRLGHDL
jgi:hypothetical protein